MAAEGGLGVKPESFGEDEERELSKLWAYYMEPFVSDHTGAREGGCRLPSREKDATSVGTFYTRHQTRLIIDCIEVLSRSPSPSASLVTRKVSTMRPCSQRRLMHPCNLFDYGRVARAREPGEVQEVRRAV